MEQTSATAGSRFPRSARILNGAAYAPVFRSNRRFADRYWTILVRMPLTDGASGNDGGTAGATLGLAIAKKRAKRAVDRNRLKRIARESFRHRRGALAGREVVVMNRDAATTASAHELREAIDKLWSAIERAGAARRGGT